MKKYIAVAVSGSAVENLANALAGIGEKDRRITALWARDTFATTVPTGTNLRAYKNQDQLVDFPLDGFKNGLTSSTALLALLPRIELELDLVKGDGFKVGFYKSGATPGGTVTLEYEDKS